MAKNLPKRLAQTSKVTFSIFSSNFFLLPPKITTYKNDTPPSFFLFNKWLLLSREPKNANFFIFFDEKNFLNCCICFFKKNMVTQRNGVQQVNNGRKIQVFFALYISEGLEKNIFCILVKKLVPNLELKPFFVEEVHDFF